VLSNLTSTWRAMKADPVGILLPTAGVLLVQLTGSIALRQAWPQSTWLELGGVAVVVHAAGIVLSAPLRAAILGAAAEARGRPVVSSLRAPALAIVLILTAALQTLLVAASLGIGALAAMALSTRGMYTLSTLAVAAAVLFAALLSLLVRAVFGFAPAEAVVAGKGGFRAMWHGISGSQVIQVALLLLIGDIALALGSVCCGVGALPSYPIGELAVLDRWLGRLP
jgi:hypothetical protein